MEQAGVPPVKEEGFAVMTTPPKRLVEPREPPATLPRFDPVLPDLNGSSGSLRLKVHLARLQLEAEEREMVREAEFNLKLQIHQLEFEAEKESCCPSHFLILWNDLAGGLCLRL
ncbi:hypothetical protein ATANTOWER_018209 [Ataeniobius toweri]|uniref:Uncharacterized protein n=1 Tax=Ataeniobius toweri TaxID=208326 RepID=A0ABU7AHT5_9TELE|nr:hypothetical protein [Ataeniobius toweri]